MKRINIYLTENERDELQKIQRKYKISMSTIADKVITAFFHAHLHYATNKEDNNKLLATSMTSKAGNYKTTVKPKVWYETPLFTDYLSKYEGFTKSIYTTNVLKIYISKLIKFYLTEEGTKMFYNEINKEFTNAKETWWNYNNAVRNQTRAIKQNKEYYKRLLNA